MTSVSVVIPTFKKWTLAHQLLFDIYQKFPQDVEVIVVDDCSGDQETLDGLTWWKTLYQGRLHIFINQVNAGFLKTANFGVSKATSDIVILINTDVRIHSKEAYEQTMAMFSLVTDKPILVGGKKYSESTGWNDFDGRIFPYIEGWYLAFRKDDWDKFGGFDLRFVPNDMEDVDLSTTYLANGGVIVAITEGLLTHIGAQSMGYTMSRQKITQANKIKFGEKWLK